MTPLPANDPARPESFERRILLVVTGLSPQVLTETLYALCFPRRGAAFVPTEVRVLSTATGVRKLQHSLLDGENGQFRRLLRDWDLPPIAFDAACITTLCDAEGRPMEDIRSPQDNERAADAIIEWVRGFSADPRCALHVSLAGGRKTMGFLAGYALSLFGRMQDRLSHVLVNSPFEQMPDFYYPPPRPVVLKTADGRIECSSDQARIELAPIPFVRLLEDLPATLLGRGISFSAAVQTAQERIGPVLIEFDLGSRGLRCGGQALRLPPQLYAFYLWHARRAQTLGAAAPLSWKEVGSDEIAALLRTYLEVLNRDDAAPDYLEAVRALRHGFDKDAWAMRISDIHEVLDKALGRSAAEPYRFSRQPVPGGGRMLRRGLCNLPAERILIRNAPRR